MTPLPRSSDKEHLLMHLGIYHFTGDTERLLAGYDRLMASFPTDSLLLHVCVETSTGIDVYDSCPSPEVFASFSRSDEFRTAISAAGLPEPRVESVGSVRNVVHNASPIPFR